VSADRDGVSITQRLAELEQERVEQWTTLEKATARIAGIDVPPARIAITD
jgi:hypothetical protein